MAEERRTVVFVGGGLAGGLGALRFAQLRPDVDTVVLEAGSALGGDHTWCLHGADLLPGDGGSADWIRPLMTRDWPSHDVRFPGFSRTLPGTYHALRAAPWHRQVSAVLGRRLRLGTTVRAIEPGKVTLDDGAVIRADVVVDARGAPVAEPPGCAFQKFFGLFVRTATPHGINRPLLMDATVGQADGFRFMYVLPWSDDELLVEDTRFSADSSLAPADLRPGIHAYLRQRGLAPFTVTSEERGVLPLPLHGVPPPVAPPGIVLAGVRAGLFHPTTGYSLPEAARFADWLATRPHLDGYRLGAEAACRAAEIWRRAAFCRRLNNMLFLAAPPPGRRAVLAQFYRRDHGLIGRFYGGRLTVLDRLRLLSGRPPVPALAGVRAFLRSVEVARG